MSYEVLEVIELPVVERETDDGKPVFSGDSIRKRPGDKVTKAELKEAGQTDEDIESRVKSGALKEV